MSERLFSEEFLQRLERLALVAPRAMARQTQGERLAELQAPRRGQRVEFADFRPYVPGDDFRRIDWNAYARLERFFIKLFVEEEDLTVHFLIDCSRSMHWGDPSKLAYATRAAGALGYIALAGLDRVTVTGVLTGAKNGAYFPPHRGKQQTMKLFSFLLGLQKPVDANGAPNNVTRALQTYAATAPAPGPLRSLPLRDRLADRRERLAATARRQRGDSGRGAPGKARPRSRIARPPRGARAARGGGARVAPRGDAKRAPPRGRRRTHPSGGRTGARNRRGGAPRAALPRPPPHRRDPGGRTVTCPDLDRLDDTALSAHLASCPACAATAQRDALLADPLVAAEASLLRFRRVRRQAVSSLLAASLLAVALLAVALARRPEPPVVYLLQGDETGVVLTGPDLVRRAESLPPSRPMKGDRL